MKRGTRQDRFPSGRDPMGSAWAASLSLGRLLAITLVLGGAALWLLLRQGDVTLMRWRYDVMPAHPGRALEQFLAGLREFGQILSVVIALCIVAAYDRRRKTIIIVDEANMLRNKEILAEFRGLLNLEVPGSKLITFVLIGLPELDEWLEQDAPLKQRVAVRFTLHALSQSATKSYIEHRLKIAGCETLSISDEAHQAIFRYSQGIPRLINTICDNALLEGFLVKKKEIELPIIEDVVIGLGL